MYWRTSCRILSWIPSSWLIKFLLLHRFDRKKVPSSRNIILWWQWNLWNLWLGLFILKPVYKGTDGFWAPPWPFCCVSLVWKLKFPTSCLSAALYLLSIEGGRKNDLRHKEWLWLNNLVFTAIELWVVDKSCHTPNSPSSFFIQHTEKCSSELHIIKVQIYLIIYSMCCK